MKTVNVFFGSIIKPYSTFERILISDNRIRIGWIYTIGFAFLYSITAGLLAINHWEPSPQFPPFLPIPTKDYYFYQIFFTIPVGVVSVGINNYLSYGLSHLFGSDVKSKDLWGPISVASTVPYFFFTWLPETFYHPWQEPGTILFTPQIEISRQIIAGLWCVGLNIIAITAITKLKWWKSSMIGIISTAALGIFMLTFVR